MLDNQVNPGAKREEFQIKRWFPPEGPGLNFGFVQQTWEKQKSEEYSTEQT